MATRRAHIVTCGLGALLLAGCAAPAPAADATTSPRATDNESTAHCRAYAGAARGARTPLDAMRAGPVLSPFVALIEVAAREVAGQAGAAPDPAGAGAMRELAAALDDLDAQGRAALPPGADLTSTPVKLDPTRLAAALDAADRACAPHTR